MNGDRFLQLITAVIFTVTTTFAQPQLDCDLFGIGDTDCNNIFFRLGSDCYAKYGQGIDHPKNYCGNPILTRETWQCIPLTRVNTTGSYRCGDIYDNVGLNYTITCQSDRTYVQADLDNIDRICGRPSQEILADRLLSLVSDVVSKRWIEHKKYVDDNHERIDIIHKTLRIGDLLICTIGFILLLVLIPLKNERVMLHRNLILSFIFNDIIILAVMFEYPTDKVFSKTQPTIDDQDHIFVCSMLSVVQKYFFLCQVCWLFNELFYQFRQIFFVFVVSRSYFWLYFTFGWGFPYFLVFGIYLPYNWHNPHVHNFMSCWIYVLNNNTLIVNGPAYFLLLINLLMMTYLMYIIWSKLKKHLMDRNKNFKKSARSFIVIVVLIGVGYGFTTYGPKDCVEFDYYRVILIPIQGSLVAIFHIYMSREVMESIRKKYRNWTSEAELRTPSEYSSTRKFSLFARQSRNTSVTSMSSQNNSRRPSNFPSISEGGEIKLHSTNSSAQSSPKLQRNSIPNEDTTFDEKNPVQNGYLPPAPPPILGPMSHVYNRRYDSELSADVHNDNAVPTHTDPPDPSTQANDDDDLKMDKLKKNDIDNDPGHINEAYEIGPDLASNLASDKPNEEKGIEA